MPSQATEAFSAVGRFAQPDPLFIIISGPSGVGKDSVIKRMQELDHSFHFVVTATDRPKRPGEVDGIDYCFVTTSEFERMIAEGELLEHAVPAVLFAHERATICAHARTEIGVSGQFQDAFGQGLFRVGEPAVLPGRDELAVGGDVRGHDRQAVGHGFDHGVRQPLPAGVVHEDIRVPDAL